MELSTEKERVYLYISYFIISIFHCHDLVDLQNEVTEMLLDNCNVLFDVIDTLFRNDDAAIIYL